VSQLQVDCSTDAVSDGAQVPLLRYGKAVVTLHGTEAALYNKGGIAYVTVSAICMGVEITTVLTMCVCSP
jgi:hypothetical protein